MSNPVNILKAHKSPSESKWKEKALWRKRNATWLNYSRLITLKVLSRMEECGVTQSALAEKMNCSQQYVSNLLKGSSNMTLETISRLEEALDFKILNLTSLSVHGYGVQKPGPLYLSDSER